MAHTGANICIFLLASAASRPNFSPIIELKVMISGIAFDRFDLLSLLRAFPFDRFKIYTIVPIVRIELSFNPSDRGRPNRPGRLRSSR